MQSDGLLPITHHIQEEQERGRREHNQKARNEFIWQDKKELTRDEIC